MEGNTHSACFVSFVVQGIKSPQKSNSIGKKSIPTHTFHLCTDLLKKVDVSVTRTFIKTVWVYRTLKETTEARTYHLSVPKRWLWSPLQTNASFWGHSRFMVKLNYGICGLYHEQSEPTHCFLLVINTFTFNVFLRIVGQNSDLNSEKTKCFIGLHYMCTWSFVSFDKMYTPLTPGRPTASFKMYLMNLFKGKRKKCYSRLLQVHKYNKPAIK